jgi:hypothetical protein
MKTIRRLYFYLVALVSLEVVTWALISLLRSIFDESLSDVLAGGLAFILVGLPVFLFHWRVVQREAAAESEERFSGVRALFLYAAWVSLAIPVVQSVLSIVLRLLAILFDVNRQTVTLGGNQNWSDNLIAILVNAVLAAYFLSVIRKDWQADPPDDAFPLVRRLNRYLWVLYGLGMTFGGTVMLLEFIFGQVRTASFGLEVLLVDALGLILVGVPVWLYSWRIVQQVGEPSLVRTATLYALTLLGALAALLSSGNTLRTILLTLIAEGSTWTRAWGDLEIALSVMLPSAAVWAYHWSVLKQDINKIPAEVQQHTQRRPYFYILSLAGLIATFFALQLLVTLLVEAFFCSPGDPDTYGSCQRLLEVQLPNVIAVLLVSVPVWLLHWRPAQSRALLDNELGDSARSSLLRKGYLYLVLFAGVIGSMVTTGWLLYELIGSILGIASTNFGQTLLTLLGTLVLFLVFTTYHWRLLRADNQKLDKTIAAYQQAFPVAVVSRTDGFSEQVRQTLAALAPHIPLITQTADQPLVEGLGDARAVIFPADLLIGADGALQEWLNAFEGERLVLPTAAEGWVWLGLTEQSLERQIRQAARVIQQLAEAGETKAARSLSPAAVIGYVLGAILGLMAICILSSLIIELFG